MGKVIYMREFLQKNNKNFIFVGSIIQWSYAPNSPILEAEVTKIVYMIPGTHNIEQETPFVDISKTLFRLKFYTKDNVPIPGNLVIGKKVKKVGLNHE